MISGPQINSLAAAIARLGETVETMAQQTAPAPNAASGDGIVVGNGGPGAAPRPTSLAEAALALGGQAAATPAAASGAPPAAPVASLLQTAAVVTTALTPAAAATKLQQTVATLLQDAVATPEGRAYAEPAVARALTTIAAGVVGAAAPPPTAGPLATVAALLRAVAAAADAPAFAAAVSELRSLLMTSSASLPAALSTYAAASTPTQAQAQPPTSAPLLAVPPFDPSARTSAAVAARKNADAGPDVRARTPLVPVPERDPQGRRYSERARARLAQLGADPRHGFAPEAEIAFAAEERWGVVFARAFDSEHDFIDNAGHAWDVVAPSSADGFEVVLRSLSAHAGVLVATAGLPTAERSAAAAILARCAAAGTYPVVVVDSESEDEWPGS